MAHTMEQAASGEGRDGMLFGGADRRPPQRRSWGDRTFRSVEAGSVRGSIFSLCCSAIGMGVLLLPYTMAQVGPLCALVLLAFSAFVGYISLRVCCAGMHATQSRSYVETLTVMFSERFATGLTAMLVVACFGLCCGYLVFSSQLILQLFQLSGFPAWLCKRWLIVILSSIAVFPLAMYRNLSDFRYLTIVSTGGLLYLSVLVISRVERYSGTADLPSGWWWRVSEVGNMLKCLSLCFSAYIVHMNVFACYAELQNPTPARLKKVLRRSTFVQSALYVVVAVCGFMSFGARTPDNILQAYDLEDHAANIGRVFVSFQLLLAVPLTVHPGRTYLWPLLCMTVLRKRQARERTLPLTAPAAACSVASGGSATASFASTPVDLPQALLPEQAASPSSALVIPEMTTTAHLSITVGFVAMSALVAAKVESASDLLGVVGGFAAVTYAFLLPAEMAKKLRERNAELRIDWATSPASFIPDSRGLLVIHGLRICCVLGYIAAAQCAYNMATGAK